MGLEHGPAGRRVTEAVQERDALGRPQDHVEGWHGVAAVGTVEHQVAVIRPEHLARLLKSCEARDFTSRRDTAIILLLVDTGMRRAECVGMTLDDVDLNQRIA